MVRTELQTSLHRLANHIECELVDVFRDLLAEGRVREAQTIAYAGCGFVDDLREARDESAEGGDA